jgi:ectoine hydroxylase-related dioxygenase (phytanoyl-CoA dioxygenase family)
MKHDLDSCGFFLAKHCFTEPQVQQLLAITHELGRENSNYGVRNILQRVPALCAIINSSPVRRLIEPILGRTAVPVRSLYFDKNPEANWNVAWHQDTMIAVTEKFDLPGFGPWSEKAGIMHVEPPGSLLENILTMRIHLDQTDQQNGALRIIPGSHKYGRLTSAEILNHVENTSVVTCAAEAGDVLLMRPLLLHSSRKSTNPLHRRIIHIEFSSVTLPSPLQWREV